MWSGPPSSCGSWSRPCSPSASVIRELEAAFAGTRLADYERWEADDVLAEEVFSLGRPWASGGSRGDDVARVTFPASFYFAERCVVGTWTVDGFSAEPLEGPACTKVVEPERS